MSDQSSCTPHGDDGSSRDVTHTPRRTGQGRTARLGWKVSKSNQDDGCCVFWDWINVHTCLGSHDFNLFSSPPQWIPCGQCVGCHNTVNCGQCANCKHRKLSPDSRKRVCRKRKCMCPVRKVGPADVLLSYLDADETTLEFFFLLLVPPGFWKRKFCTADELWQSWHSYRWNERKGE